MQIFKPNFEKGGGLVPVVAQDKVSGQILMLAYANEDAYLKTLETGLAHYYSRSRKKIWKKGEASGNFQLVYQVLLDCDGDALIYRVLQKGIGACHTGAKSCFYRHFSSCGQFMEAPNAGKGEKLAFMEAEVCGRLKINCLIQGS